VGAAHRESVAGGALHLRYDEAIATAQVYEACCGSGEAVEMEEMDVDRDL
jgi:hypothetical protein